jgi:hypothetical protein
MDLSGDLGEEWMHGEIKKKLDLFNMNMLGGYIGRRRRVGAFFGILTNTS